MRCRMRCALLGVLLEAAVLCNGGSQPWGACENHRDSARPRTMPLASILPQIRLTWEPPAPASSGSELQPKQVLFETGGWNEESFQSKQERGTTRSKAKPDDGNRYAPRGAARTAQAQDWAAMNYTIGDMQFSWRAPIPDQELKERLRYKARWGYYLAEPGEVSRVKWYLAENPAIEMGRHLIDVGGFQLQLWGRRLWLSLAHVAGADVDALFEPAQAQAQAKPGEPGSLLRIRGGQLEAEAEVGRVQELRTEEERREAREEGRWPFELGGCASGWEFRRQCRAAVEERAKQLAGERVWSVNSAEQTPDLRPLWSADTQHGRQEELLALYHDTPWFRRYLAALRRHSQIAHMEGPGPDPRQPSLLVRAAEALCPAPPEEGEESEQGEAAQQKQGLADDDDTEEEEAGEGEEVTLEELAKVWGKVGAAMHALHGEKEASGSGARSGGSAQAQLEEVKQEARALLQRAGVELPAESEQEALEEEEEEEEGEEEGERTLLSAAVGAYEEWATRMCGTEADRALWVAAERGDVRAVAAAVAAGARVRAEDGWGRTALHRAVRADDGAEVVKELVRLGARVDWQDHEGCTAVARAAYWGAVPALRLLLGAGADPELPALRLRRALHWAALGGQAGSVEALVEGGAEVEAEDADGQTAVQLARGAGHADAAATLLRLRRLRRRRAPHSAPDPALLRGGLGYRRGVHPAAPLAKWHAREAAQERREGWPTLPPPESPHLEQYKDWMVRDLEEDQARLRGQLMREGGVPEELIARTSALRRFEHMRPAALRRLQTRLRNAGHLPVRSPAEPEPEPEPEPVPRVAIKDGAAGGEKKTKRRKEWWESRAWREFREEQWDCQRAKPARPRP